MEKVSYAGWPNCRRLSNGVVELVVTADVGPRIIRLAFEGGENILKEFAEQAGKTGGEEWRIYGGHRLWHAPEEKPRTYFPDNGPVEVSEEEGAVTFTPPSESTTGIQKEIEIRLAEGAPRVEIVHRLLNTNLWAVELAPWALTVMAQGGRAIVPLPPRGSHEENLLPTSTVTLWAYTDMADPRWTWGRKYVLLRQDPGAELPQKAGFSVPSGWAAYAKAGELFVKCFSRDPCATYPDFGCNVEAFTNSEMLELESLGAMVRLQPGVGVEHVERWHLFKDVPPPESEADVDEHVLPRVQEVKRR